MTEQEILKLWRSGLSKYKLADIYRSRYNKQIKLKRLEIRNRNAGRFITS